MNEHLKAARDMLEFHGIKPDAPLQEGLSAEGYYTWEVIDRGEGMADGIDLPFHAWPINFPVASFFEHYWAWKNAVV